MENPSVFTLAGVRYVVQATSILSDISLDIHSGEHWALMGPSGAGKSTLLRLFNGLISPSFGEIRFHGRPLESVDVPSLRKIVGMLFQEAVLINGTVRDNLTLPLRWLRPAPEYTEERLVEALKRVDLTPDHLTAQARSLSGGEKQRVALARVLLNDPEVLLL
ncbi:MAG: ATP-binding cassette domain-containing protein, partial [Fidelibacterota bacterium]